MDKKSDHYTSAERYTDLDGQSRQFTFVDHDKKTKIGTSKSTKDELQLLEDSLIFYKKQLADQILSLPAVSAIRNSDLYEEFIIRDPDKGIMWQENAVREAIMINPVLGHNLFLQVWRKTVKEPYWYNDMSHEDIIAGKWKELI